MINKLDSELNFEPLQRLSFAEQSVYYWIRNYPHLSTSLAYQRFLFHEQNTMRNRITGVFTETDINQYCYAASRFLDYVYSLRLNPYMKDTMNAMDEYRQQETGDDTYLKYLAQ